MPFFSFFNVKYKAIKHDISISLHTTTTSSPQPILTSTPPQIPLQIIITILESTCHPQNPFNNSHLLNCALVSTLWSLPAQKLLFRNVTLRNHHAYLAFQAALTNSTTLATSVHRILVVLDHNQPYGISQHSFAHALTLCPNLYYLHLSLFGRAEPGKDIIGLPDLHRMRRPAPSFNHITLSLLKSGPKITALHFSNWSENRHSLNQLLDLWVSLKSLVITGTPPELSSPYPGTLHHFRINCQSPPSIDYIQSLLSNSTNSLRTIELEREPSTDLLNHLIQSHRHQLHSLALPACGSHDHTLAVRSCEQLRELKIENPWVSPIAYRKLPTVLRHLALGLDGDTALQPVIDLVNSRPSSSLALITIRICDGGQHHPQLPALKTACERTGVQLCVDWTCTFFFFGLVCLVCRLIDLSRYFSLPLYVRCRFNMTPYGMGC